MEAIFSTETSVDFELTNGLHGDISQNIEVFITTGVKTSNPMKNNSLKPEEWVRNIFTRKHRTQNGFQYYL
jgi:hypothetical protein